MMPIIPCSDRASRFCIPKTVRDSMKGKDIMIKRPDKEFPFHSLKCKEAFILYHDQKDKIHRARMLLRHYNKTYKVYFHVFREKSYLEFVRFL